MEQNKKIFITGVKGYIGSVLADSLIRNGYEVGGLDTGFYKDVSLYDGLLSSDKILEKDVRNVTAEDLMGYDAIIHLAELSNDPLGEMNKELTIDINHGGTTTLAEKAKLAGVPRFIYSSSCSVYGFNDDKVNENSPANPLTTYAKMKIENEKKLTLMADDNFCPVFLRNATVYGPSPSMRFDLVINYICGTAQTAKIIDLKSDGQAWRPFIHINDLANVFTAMVNAPTDKVYCQIFNIGSDKSNYKIRDTAEIIKKEMPECELRIQDNNPDRRSYNVGFTKLETAFPELPAFINMENGIKNMLDLFKNISMTKEKFESKSFTRIKQINNLLESGAINSSFFWNK